MHFNKSMDFVKSLSFMTFASFLSLLPWPNADILKFIVQDVKTWFVCIFWLFFPLSNKHKHQNKVVSKKSAIAYRKLIRSRRLAISMVLLYHGSSCFKRIIGIFSTMDGKQCNTFSWHCMLLPFCFVFPRGKKH